MPSKPPPGLSGFDRPPPPRGGSSVVQPQRVPEAPPSPAPQNGDLTGQFCYVAERSWWRGERLVLMVEVWQVYYGNGPPDERNRRYSREWRRATVRDLTRNHQFFAPHMNHTVSTVPTVERRGPPPPPPVPLG